MRRRVLLCLALATASACQGGDSASPVLDPASPPSRAISDGSHCATASISCAKGNPDFFFLPPMVRDPRHDPAWDAHAANGSLAPTVDICELDATSESAIRAHPETAACRSGGYRFSRTLGPNHVSRGIRDDDDMDHVRFRNSHYGSFAESYYHFGWEVPSPHLPRKAPPVFYRIAVGVGATRLGFIDIESVSTLRQLLNVQTGEFVPMAGGIRLPVNFRIERYALCAMPGSGPCESETVDLGAGGTVSTVLPGGMLPAGIVVAPASGNGTVTLTVQSCSDFNPRATDLPTFGDCVRIVSDPALPSGGFAVPATVFICDVSDLTVAGRVASHEQSERITLHRLDPDPSGGQIVTALPHAPACGAPTASTGGSFQGMLADLREGNLRSAARRLGAMLSPTPLHAARFIDLGGGGFTLELSDFQFALPAKMTIVAGTDDQTAAPGSMLSVSPAVAITDLGGEPVMGARVTFSTADGSAAPTGVVTSTTPAVGDSGIARTGWTIRGTTGVNTLHASGRGIAGADYNGPRDGVDPFQPIQTHFDGYGASSDPAFGKSVLVRTGSVDLHAHGLVLDTGFEPDDASWPAGQLVGYWHVSALTGVSNAAYPLLVNLGAGDNSGGALPAPFDAHALWFAVETGANAGNYAGPLAPTGQAGGTSLSVHAGTASSPVFLVPDVANAVRLTFRSWFEIESVNSANFDVMEVIVQDLDAGTSATLLRLNPAVDPGGNARTPLTSGGFDLPPVWQSMSVDLSAYKGRHVALQFSFDTRDVLYNGFRGWIVDDVAVRTFTAAGAATTRIPLRRAEAPRAAGAPLESVPARVWHP